MSNGRVPQPLEHEQVHQADEEQRDSVAGHEERDLEAGLGVGVVGEAAPEADIVVHGGLEEDAESRTKCDQII